MKCTEYLICEDDPVILSAMSSYLSSWGYEVRCVKNFKDVMTEFGEFAPELVLLDISLPFFNGYHWCTGNTQGLKCARCIHIERIG